MVSRSASACIGWPSSDSRLTIGTTSTADHALELAVLEHPGADGGVVAGQRAGDVLDALADVERDLVAPDGHGMAAELHDRHLHRVAGAGRRLLEQQGHAPAGQHLRQVRPLGQVEHGAQLVGVEVVDLEEVPHASSPAARPRPSRRRGRRPGWRRPRRSRRRRSVSGGANRSERRRDRVDDEAGGERRVGHDLGVERRASSSAASSRPRPRTADDLRAAPRAGRSAGRRPASASAGDVLALHDRPARPGPRRRPAAGRRRWWRGRPAAWPRPRRAGPSRRRSARRCRAPWPW